jgi:hypothetical protein
MTWRERSRLARAGQRLQRAETALAEHFLETGDPWARAACRQVRSLRSQVLDRAGPVPNEDPAEFRDLTLGRGSG